jgi:hypothetical protein
MKKGRGKFADKQLTNERTWNRADHLTSKQFSATLVEMDSLNPQVSKNFPYRSKLWMPTILFLIAVLSGISGYLIGVRAGKSTKSQLVSQPTPSSQASTITTTTPWQTFADVKLGAIFEYPTTWKVIHKTTNNSITGTGTDYSVVFDDTTVPGNKVNIFISSVNNPENLSLADFYRKYAPGGAERFKNISFQEIVNPHGVRFEKIVQPYTNPDYSPFLETIHNNRVDEISVTIPISLWSGVPLDSNYRQDPIFQKALTGYNHLINTFTFMQ